MRFLLLFLSFQFSVFSFQEIKCQYTKQPVDYVNPFIGTINYGATNPGAVCPMGMLSVVPFNVTKAEGNDYNMDEGWSSTPYWHDNKVITGFSHVNFSSVGCPDLGSILLMPTTGELEVDHNQYGSEYFEETASPGYYRTFLKKHGVIAEMTATTRSGISHYQFPAGESHILVNLGLGLTNENGAFVKRVSETEIEGFKMLGTFCYNPQNVFPIYFVVRVSKKPEKIRYWKFHKKLIGDKTNWCSTDGTYKIYEKYWKELAGDDIGVVFSYNTRPNESINVQVGISYVSIENARENLDKEQEGFQFAKVREAARQEWSEYLNIIKVEGGTEDDKEMFYTAFYHTLLHPNIFNDVNGQYPAMGTGKVSRLKAQGSRLKAQGSRLRGQGSRVKAQGSRLKAQGSRLRGQGSRVKAQGSRVKAQGSRVRGQGSRVRFTMFSLWDTYRNLHPMKSLLFPEQQLGMVRTMLDMYKESGALPKWEFAGQNFNVMEGDPALIVISDTYLRGLTDFNVDLAWEAMYHHAFAPGKDNLVRRDNDFYLEHHYIPILRDHDNSVSQAIEYYAADYAFSEFAKAIGRDLVAEDLHKRSLGYKKYFDPTYGLLRPIKPDGEFFEPFDPKMGKNFAPSHGFHEGTSWNYSFALPHDIPGLINLIGSKKAFVNSLETCFRDSLFDMTNEPDMGYPWYFNFIKGEERRTQKYVDYCLRNWFSTEPDGLPGNDDAGTLSTWLMCAMMGIYPVTPGKPIYTISTPKFKKITIKLNKKYYPKGELIIETDKDPGQYKYLKGNKFFITHEELVNVGVLKLKLKK
ncbi:MAG: GH92 family glycosyl hydrolase [Bacteroidota bacterium]|nr:GH92 family glycosyl hydrolase [Bacteroidota bacterium]